VTFNSLLFVIFFASVLAIYSLPLSWRIRKTHLLLSSYIFYAAWNPPFVLLLWLSTVVDWFAARRMATCKTKRWKLAFLFLSLATNLGLLGFFKYGKFMLDNFTALTQTMGFEFVPPPFSVVLPVGISFYTFQTLSYTIDVYRKKMAPWGSFLDFALYVSFFPQLVAGPIVRSGTFLPQCQEPRRASANQFGWGLSLLLLGIFQKTVLADTVFAPFVDRVFNQVSQAGCLSAWLAAGAFSGQIFFDFSGYSNCAIGAAMCLGFLLPRNFRAPYAAIGFSDFWRRWHISLSTWLRDYLYVPLGGNRQGQARAFANVLITMLLGGLWHGASWHFVAWGGIHAAFLVAERLLRQLAKKLNWRPRLLGNLAAAFFTFGLVSAAWVFFRVRSISDAGTLVRAMFTGKSGSLSIGAGPMLLIAAAVVAMFGGQWMVRNRELAEVWSRMPWPLRSAVLAVMGVAIVLSPGADRVFIYFQF
jgi:alginate O-acetyltransferase complex protein AlgI